jgi:hypothetical protein
MNIATQWREERIDDRTIRFVQDHTFNGTVVVTATKTDDGIVWENQDDASFAIIERAEAALA